MTEFVAVEEFRRLVPENAFSAPSDSSDGNAPWEHATMGLGGIPRRVQHLGRVFTAVRERHLAEFPDLVYLEIKEHHGRGDQQHVFHSLSTYEFNQDGKITGIRVAPAARHLVTAGPA
jgi:hypothetical protein